MTRRFYWIERADELKAAKDNYEAWQRKSRAEKSADYKAQLGKTGNKRNAFKQQEAYIKPFGVDAAQDVFAKVKVIQAGATAGNANEEAPGGIATDLAAALVAEGSTLYATTTRPAAVGAVIVKPRTIRDYARVILSEKDPGSTVDGLTSRITGAPYRYVKKDSCGSVFGRKLTGSEDWDAAKATLRTALIGNSEVRSLSFRAENNIDIDTV